MSPTLLPSPRTHLSSLFSSFSSTFFPAPTSAPEEETPSNPLLLSAPPPQTVKPFLLTLHVLFPNELLPALDLLDRRLVTKIILLLPQQQPLHASETGAGEGEGGVEANGAARGRRREVYYVRSSASSSSSSQRFRSAAAVGGRRRTYDAFAASKGYEVRLRGWNCTCPAFVLAWMGCLGGGAVGGGMSEEGGVPPRDKGQEEHHGLSFGGLMRGEEGEVLPPVCKHLLACALAESWGGFRGFVEEREVGREEMGGWAAGWGG